LLGALGADGASSATGYLLREDSRFCLAERMTVSEEREVKLLSLVDVLEPLSEEELEEVSIRCPSFSLDAGQEFYGSGEHDRGLFLLEEGHVVIYKMTSSGKQISFAVHSAGTVLPALRLQDLIARALEPSVFAIMSREDLEYFLRRKPQIGLRLMDLLAENLRLMDARISDVIHKRVSARLASLIAWLIDEEGIVVGGGDLVVPYPYTHEQLGTIIGARRVAVTLAFKALQDEGAVELSQRRIHVKDLELLQRIAEQES
jgi:CRP/FNR family transcriptional regulator, cyclic AMP receptor protein